ncbi:hypothetical protein [Mycolicibacterium helvum]|uniref:PE-PGRS family protein n=1 Tax=Mycolicibacterium helvum TaxID=1534349 RepID=A0A7I7T277_9MYCO|nr:hypothetical protein [Mycolicibacterium helvum]BBY63178.1 hypothetical protein MHEL_14210 [Mycolicibacterium helvum]
MHVAVRSTVATGVALVGASAIALSPIQPVGSVALPLSGVNVPAAISNVAVELAAQTNPFEAWVNVLTQTVTNAGALGTALVADPLPVVRQVAQNWIGYGQTTATALGDFAAGLNFYLFSSEPYSLPYYVKTVLQQLAAGELAAAASSINESIGSAIIRLGLPLFPLTNIPGAITDNLTAAVKSLTSITTLFGLLVGGLSPIEGVIQAAGDSGQVIVDSLGAGDFGAAAQALLNIPPTLVGAFINGYTSVGGSVFQGILSPPDENGVNPGLLYTLLVNIPKALATAITPVSASASAAARLAKPATSVEAAPATDATESTGSTDSAASSDATEASSGSSATAGVGGSRVTGKKDTKAQNGVAAKKPTGAKSSTGAKSARPHAGNGGGGGSAE